MPEEIKAKVEDVLEKLTKLNDNISDSYNSTHGILETLSQFAYTGLDDLISDVEEIRDDLEDLEEAENQ
ncbi:hypothetical protein J41TS12_50440 [Paenibacillus antibioticophila]|uniref:Uncharacterized protein n=1 Tax=Paenibacillus antibioticophila TaxID=1274374 RepID=A0A920CJZ7_9BACL|nr:hypothetical protein [Paenibacillus antibioticophila]GIO40183.1 hypothetical protein J41TS12_50440 [Paenibacillus antibioticophila]